jgi:malate dehydrogenase (oxaloacetate-decarboxylating)(NADP+)
MRKLFGTLGAAFTRVPQSPTATNPRLGGRDVDAQAIAFHAKYPAGKVAIAPTKPMATVDDLSLAYTPGVAAPCREIAAVPDKSYAYTSRANLVAVVTNGTAVLGLGDIGPVAAKPVMEGKAVLLKRFAGIDAFDLEINERDPKKLASIVASLEPTFGGVILEDIKAPDCFVVEDLCIKSMSIPVMHDDQHGTAVCVAAAIRNALVIAGKELRATRIVCSGAGAASIASLDLLVQLGATRKNIVLLDSRGVVYKGRRKGLNPYKKKYAVRTRERNLEQAIDGADIFIGVSEAGVLNAKWLTRMAERPIILALSNPIPEVMPEDALAVRPDAIVATGRSDYPNQVNNVLCFPFIFRGALDAGASKISANMKIAAVNAIAALAREEVHRDVRALYPNEDLTFGPGYILPKPFDARLAVTVSAAVAAAAAKEKNARTPPKDWPAFETTIRNRLGSGR